MNHRFSHIFLLSFLLTNVFVVQHQLIEHQGESCHVCLQAETLSSALPNEVVYTDLSLLPHQLLNDQFNRLKVFTFNPLIEPIRGSPFSRY